MFVKKFLASAGKRLRTARSGRSGFVADRKGATAVEFALIGGPFFLILFAIFESAFLVFNQGNLEYATYEASRQLLTGSIQSSGANNATQLSNFKTLVCSRLWASFSCANVLINVKAAADFNATFNTSKDLFLNGGAANTFSPGVTNQVVVVRVGYPYPLYFNKFSGFGTGGTANIMAVTVFKAENY